MCELWNKFDIVPPPINTAKVVIRKKDVIELREITTEFSKELDTMELLHKEAAILSRLIYRMKLKFRSDKGFKAMEKVNRSLLRYLNTDVQCDIKNFTKTINLKNYSDNGTIYLPSRQMLEHVLVRLQGFSKLFCRIVDSCLIASNYMLERINSGQSWPIGLLVFSVLSKICSITKDFAKFICNTYQKLYNYYDKLQPTGLKWLPENVNLETDLEKWLNEEWFNEELTAPINKSNDNKIFDLIDFNDDDVEFDLDFLMDTASSKTEKNKKQNPVNILQADMSKIDPKKTVKMYIDQSSSNKIIHNTEPIVDFGKPVSRNMFDSTRKKTESVSERKNSKNNRNKSISTKISAPATGQQNSMQPDVDQNVILNDTSDVKLKKHAVRFISNKEDLKRFMIKETKYRKKNSPKCLSKRLDDIQWRKLQKLAVKSLKKLNSDETEKSAKLKTKTLKQIKSDMLTLLKQNSQ